MGLVLLVDIVMLIHKCRKKRDRFIVNIDPSVLYGSHSVYSNNPLSNNPLTDSTYDDSLSDLLYDGVPRFFKDVDNISNAIDSRLKVNPVIVVDPL